MDFKKLVYAVEGRVAKITMNYPKNLNAIDGEMTTELIQALTQAKDDGNVRAILLNSANPRGFSAGGDVVTMYHSLKAKDETVRDILYAITDLVLLMKNLPKPIVAAVGGAAAGAGFSLALACDLVVASESAKFIQAFVNVGLIPDTGGLYLLTRAVGVNKASELVMTGKPVSAQEAKTLGFVSEVVTDELLQETAEKLAKRLSLGPKLSFKYMKELIYEAQFKDFAAYMKKEEAAQIACSEHPDAVEGMGAFLEKRRANFE